MWVKALLCSFTHWITTANMYDDNKLFIKLPKYSLLTDIVDKMMIGNQVLLKMPLILSFSPFWYCRET